MKKRLEQAAVYTPAKGPAPIIIPLTPEQTAQLSEHFDFVRAEHARGWKGMLVAQVWESFAVAGNKPALRVGFVPYDTAQKIVKKAL